MSINLCRYTISLIDLLRKRRRKGVNGRLTVTVIRIVDNEVKRIHVLSPPPRQKEAPSVSSKLPLRNISRIVLPFDTI